MRHFRKLRRDTIRAKGRDLVDFVKSSPISVTLDIVPNIKWVPPRKPKQKKPVSLPRFSWDKD